MLVFCPANFVFFVLFCNWTLSYYFHLFPYDAFNGRFKKYYFYCPSNKCKISYTFNLQYPFSALKQLQFRTIRFMYFYQLLSECHMAIQNNPASLFWLTLFVCLFACFPRDEEWDKLWPQLLCLLSVSGSSISPLLLKISCTSFFFAILKHKKEIQEFCK